MGLHRGKAELKYRLIRMRVAGYTFREIEKRMGISKKTLIRWNREMAQRVEASRAEKIEKFGKLIEDSLLGALVGN